jgi:hypothetical protein
MMPLLQYMQPPVASVRYFSIQILSSPFGRFHSLRSQPGCQALYFPGRVCYPRIHADVDGPGKWASSMKMVPAQEALQLCVQALSITQDEVPSWQTQHTFGDILEQLTQSS